MTRRFQHSEEKRFHVSVGAVLVNDQGEVCAHHFLKEKIPEGYNLDGLDKCYTLMRESLEDGESLEEAALRGIREEFGAEGEVGRYLGAQHHMVDDPMGRFEKTTLYLEVRLIRQNERPADDAESFTDVVWCTPEFLIERMREQGARSGQQHLDESKILETYVRLR